MVEEVETMMATPLAATLHISLDMPHVYRVLYTVSYEGRGATTPYTMNGQDQLRAFLKHCDLSIAVINIIITRVESNISYVLDLSHLDKDEVEKLLRSYAV